jgi:hypothetical protein
MENKMQDLLISAGLVVFIFCFSIVFIFKPENLNDMSRNVMKKNNNEEEAFAYALLKYYGSMIKPYSAPKEVIKLTAKHLSLEPINISESWRLNENPTPMSKQWCDEIWPHLSLRGKAFFRKTIRSDGVFKKSSLDKLLGVEAQYVKIKFRGNENVLAAL